MKKINKICFIASIASVALAIFGILILTLLDNSGLKLLTLILASYLAFPTLIYIISIIYFIRDLIIKKTNSNKITVFGKGIISIASMSFTAIFLLVKGYIPNIYIICCFIIIALWIADFIIKIIQKSKST